MTPKDEILEILRRLPDDVTVEDVMSALFFHQKVDHGLRELDGGKGIPHAEVNDRLQKRFP